MKVVILGAGAMGTGIGQVAAQNGHEVGYYDAYPGAIDRSKASIDKIFKRLVEKGRMTEAVMADVMARMNWSESLSIVDGADLVIEAVIEDLAIKKALFTAVEERVSERALLCTNTSSLSVAAISSALKHPERFGGLHFFNPAPLMPLVEIIPSIQSSDDWAETLESMMTSWGKTPVIAKDTPGFIVNKVARPYYSEAIKLLEEGVASIAEIDAALTGVGFKMGPFELMDLIGHDVNFTVTETVWSQFFYDPRFRPSITQKRLKEAGMLGRKSGRGFYNHSDDSEGPAALKAAVDLDETLSDKMVERIICMLANEGLDAVWLGIASADNVDLAMTKGVNYPKGPLAWGAEIGWSRVLKVLENCHDYYGDDRYRPCPLLRHLESGNAELGAGEMEDSFMI